MKDAAPVPGSCRIGSSRSVLRSTVVQLSARPETGAGECRLTSVKGGEEESDISSTLYTACAMKRRLDQTRNASMKIPVLGFTFGILVALVIGTVQARDDGRYSQSPLRQWFDSLKSGKGPCCSDADGFAVSDPDWESRNGHYLVRIDNQWIDVPDDAVITEPNRAGRTMVWPFKGSLGISIRCFMPGSMT